MTHATLCAGQSPILGSTKPQHIRPPAFARVRIPAPASFYCDLCMTCSVCPIPLPGPAVVAYIHNCLRSLELCKRTHQVNQFARTEFKRLAWGVPIHPLSAGAARFAYWQNANAGTVWTTLHWVSGVTQMRWFFSIHHNELRIPNVLFILVFHFSLITIHREQHIHFKLHIF